MTAEEYRGIWEKEHGVDIRNWAEDFAEDYHEYMFKEYLDNWPTYE